MANAGTLIPTKSASCGVLAQGFHKQGRLQDEFHMKVGDIVFFNWDGGRTPSDYVPFPSVDHVGLVIAVGSNGNFTSIEGNTDYDSSDYGMVKQQTRNIEDVSCVAHPNYNSQITASMIIATAKKELGTKATPVKVCKYNSWYYNEKVSGDCFDWCATFICWVYFHTEYSTVKKAYLNCKLQLFSDECVGRVGVILNVQRILKCCGYDIDITGKFDAKTKNAIKQYQKKFGLKVTGNLNPETALSLFSLEKA